MDQDLLTNITLWGFGLTAVGLASTLWGVRLTYVQASNARESAEAASTAVAEFSDKRDMSEAIQHLSRAVQSMEVASVLIDADKWKDACSAYDEARRAVQTVRSMSINLDRNSDRQLGLLASHLRAFSDAVDNALSAKECFPEKAKVRSSIRQNCDELNHLQRQLHKGLT